MPQRTHNVHTPSGLGLTDTPDYLPPHLHRETPLLHSARLAEDNPHGKRTPAAHDGHDQHRAALRDVYVTSPGAHALPSRGPAHGWLVGTGMHPRSREEIAPHPGAAGRAC